MLKYSFYLTNIHINVYKIDMMFMKMILKIKCSINKYSLNNL